jgi:4-oxalocrotonate tautomerase
MPLVVVSLIEGRSAEQKKTIMREITDTIERTLAVPRPIIRVIVQEVPPQNWSVAGEPVG